MQDYFIKTKKKRNKKIVVVIILQVRMKDLDTKEELGFHPLNRWLFEEDGSETVTELAVVRPNEAPLKGTLFDNHNIALSFKLESAET